MELSGLLDCTVADRDPDTIHPPRQHLYHTDTISSNYSTSQPTSTNNLTRPAGIRVGMASMSTENTTNGVSAPAFNDGSVSPHFNATPKCVAFELLFPESPQYRARLPMRVRIYPHDTTESIVTTVKNFYGLYSSPTTSKGVSFEDEQGNTLIARYENFSDNMVVYVRVTEEPLQPHPSQSPVSGSAAGHHYGGEAHPPQAPLAHGPELSRPNSRTSRRRSPSPNSTRGRRSVSAGTNPAASKSGRSRSSKTMTTGSQNNGDGYDSVNGYSSGDGGPGSSSSRAKEHLSNTEISVANIVEGGRRKRAKFESSELPLFAPPQMPAATSNPSVSPARRMDSHRSSISYLPTGPNPFINPRPLQSPQSYSNGFGQGIYATPVSDGGRHRGSIGYAPNGIGFHNGMGGILPTPDPTVGSSVSEEDKDVAIQLMRLGEMSNISHGRTSASTLDDTFSGRADVASSTGATSDGESESEDELPPARRQKLNSGISHPAHETTETPSVPSRETGGGSGDDADYEDGLGHHHHHLTSMAAPPRAKTGPQSMSKPKPPSVKTHKPTKTPKTGMPRPPSKTKKATVPMAGPVSPASLPPSRKQSISSAPNGLQPSIEEEQPDLSTKPRCQRCRKSKKGCDRQRPCGRCRDAGLGIDQCVSEDEGNGRKGRYGRHMGVPVQQEDMPAPAHPVLLPPALIAAAPVAAAMTADKNKKRKR